MLLIPTLQVHQTKDPSTNRQRYLIHSVGRGISGRRRDWRETRCRRGPSYYLPYDAMTLWWNHQHSLHQQSWRARQSSLYCQLLNESRGGKSSYHPCSEPLYSRTVSYTSLSCKYRSICLISSGFAHFEPFNGLKKILFTEIFFYITCLVVSSSSTSDKYCIPSMTLGSLNN